MRNLSPPYTQVNLLQSKGVQDPYNKFERAWNNTVCATKQAMMRASNYSHVQVCVDDKFHAYVGVYVLRITSTSLRKCVGRYWNVPINMIDCLQQNSSKPRKSPVTHIPDATVGVR